jgi:hypothetical protein
MLTTKFCCKIYWANNIRKMTIYRSATESKTPGPKSSVFKFWFPRSIWLRPLRRLPCVCAKSSWEKEEKAWCFAKWRAGIKKGKIVAISVRSECLTNDSFLVFLWRAFNLLCHPNTPLTIIYNHFSKFKIKKLVNAVVTHFSTKIIKRMRSLIDFH